MDYNKCFSLFSSSYIDKEIKKDVLLNNIKNKEDKEIIEKFVENVYIKYCIKADNINKEAEENFSEIEIIEININNYRTIYDIYGILLSIIPYPILAIFRYNKRISLAVSNRILSEEKNNKGKIFTSYLIKEENISNYLKVDIENCQTLKDIYEKWISNVEYVAAYYEKIDNVIQIIEKGFHIKSEEILENLESYIAKYCGTYNMKPKEGWKSKLEKYSNSPVFVKKVETHLLWEYLSENAFFKNKLIDFSCWKDFKESCSYNSLNNLYYSQYNRMLDNESLSSIDKYMLKNDESERYNVKTFVEEQKNKLKYIKKDSSSLKNISDELNENKEIILKPLDEKIMNIVQKAKNNGNIITYDELVEQLGDTSFTDEELDKIFDDLENEEITILEDKELLNQDEERVKEDFYTNEDIIDELRNDKDFMLHLLDIDVKFLEYASDELKNDKDFILQAIEKNSWSLHYGSVDIKRDKDFMLQVIEYDVWCFGYAKFELRNNPEFMLQAIEKNSLSIKYASNELKNNPDFILQAIQKDCWCIKYASNELKNNPEFMLRVIEKNSWALGYANFELRNNQKFMLQAINRDCRCVYYLSNELVSKLLLDQDFKFKINLLYNKCSINNEILTNNKDLMLQVIEKGNWCLFCASDKLKNDKDFMLQAIEKDFRCLLYVEYKLKNDKDFMLQAIEKDFRCMSYVSVVLLENKYFMLKAIEKVGQKCLYYITEKLENDKEFMLQAIEKDSRCLDYIGNELKNDVDFMLQAIEKTKSLKTKF